MNRLKPGHVLGDYTIVRFIARGGMGEVYEANDNKLDRKVALKVVTHDSGELNDLLVQRFMNEARALAKVNHPNIVTVHSIHNSGSVQYIAMEYVDGISLKDFLDEYNIAPAVAQIIFEQILSGVKRLHEHNIIHRDLKPANILIRADGQVKILDFGIAKSRDGMVHTNPGVRVGTPSYMAPELKSMEPHSVRSDLWSTGAIFYECLTGKVLSMNLKDDHLVFDRRERDLIPEGMRALTACLCASDKNDRYAKASEAMDDLQNLREEMGRPTPQDLAQFKTHLSEIKKSKSVTSFEIELPPPSESVESKLRQELQRVQPVTQKPVKSRSAKRRDRRMAILGLAFAGLFMVAIAGLIDHFSKPMRATSEPPAVNPARKIAKETRLPTPAPVVQAPVPVPVPVPEPEPEPIEAAESAPTPAQAPTPPPPPAPMPVARPVVNKKKVAAIVKKPLPKIKVVKKAKPEESRRQPASAPVVLPKLEEPLPISPAIGAAAPARNGRISITFSWFDVDRATTYVIEIASDEKFEKVIDRRKLTENKLVVEQARWQGRVYWRVQAVDAKGKTSKWSSLSFFDIL